MLVCNWTREYGSYTHDRAVLEMVGRSDEGPVCLLVELFETVTLLVIYQRRPGSWPADDVGGDKIKSCRKQGKVIGVGGEVRCEVSGSGAASKASLMKLEDTKAENPEGSWTDCRG